MRTIVLLYALAALAPGAASTDAATLMEFGEPASLDYEQLGAVGSWAFFVGSDSRQSVFTLTLDGSASGRIERVDQLFVNRDTVVERFPVEIPVLDNPRQETDARSVTIHLDSARSAIFVEGAIRATSTHGNATASGVDHLCLVQMTGGEAQDRLAHGSLCPANGDLGLLVKPGRHAEGHLAASRIDAIWLYNVTVACEGGSTCITGGGFSRERVAADGSTWIELRRQEYSMLDSGLGDLSATGSYDRLFIGGERLDLSVRGNARLPLATGGACGTACFAADDQTFRAAGELELANLRMHPDAGSRMTAEVTGDFATVQLDNAILGLGAVAEVGAVLGLTAALALAAKLIGLALSAKRADPLHHPNRRKLHDAILANPGATFRELLRHTGLPAGTARHHLQVLKQVATIQEHPHGATLRYFENHGRFDHSWNTVVLLREPDLKRLHDWLMEHPASHQKEVVEATSAWGWSRSTTQHRLKRLAAEGLVDVRQHGRRYSYQARAQAPVPEASYASIV